MCVFLFFFFRFVITNFLAPVCVFVFPPSLWSASGEKGMEKKRERRWESEWSERSSGKKKTFFSCAPCLSLFLFFPSLFRPFFPHTPLPPRAPITQLQNLFFRVIKNKTRKRLLQPI